MHRHTHNFRFRNLPISGLIIALCFNLLNTEVIAKPKVEKMAKRHYKAGIELKSKGDFEGSLSKFDAAVEIYPEYIEATLAHGVASYALGNYENAKDDFTRTIELDQESKLAYYLRGKANHSLGKLKETLNDYSQVIELAPDSASLYFERAIIKSELLDFSGAMDDFSSAVDNYREDLVSAKKKIHNKMEQNSLLLLRETDFNYKYRIYRYPYSPIDWLVFYGTSDHRVDPNLYNSNPNNDTEKLHTQPIHLFRSLQKTYMHRGELKLFLGDTDGALEDFSEAFSANENNISLGVFHYMIGNYDLASQNLQPNVEQNPTNYYSRFFLFLALSYLGEDQKAGQYLSFAKEKKKKAKRGIRSFQIADFLLGKIDDATFINAAYNDDPYIQLEQLCEAYFYAAQVHLINGNKIQAKEYLQKCTGTGISHYYEYMGATIQLIYQFKYGGDQHHKQEPLETLPHSN